MIFIAPIIMAAMSTPAGVAAVGTAVAVVPHIVTGIIAGAIIAHSVMGE